MELSPDIFHFYTHQRETFASPVGKLRLPNILCKLPN